MACQINRFVACVCILPSWSWTSFEVEIFSGVSVESKVDLKWRLEQRPRGPLDVWDFFLSSSASTSNRYVRVHILLSHKFMRHPTCEFDYWDEKSGSFSHRWVLATAVDLQGGKGNTRYLSIRKIERGRWSSSSRMSPVVDQILILPLSLAEGDFLLLISNQLKEYQQLCCLSFTFLFFSWERVYYVLQYPPLQEYASYQKNGSETVLQQLNSFTPRMNKPHFEVFVTVFMIQDPQFEPTSPLKAGKVGLKL